MLSPYQLDHAPDEIMRLIEQLEQDILEDMAAKLATYPMQTNSFAWQMQKAQELLHTREDLIRILSRQSGVSEREIERLLYLTSTESLSMDAAIYSTAGLNPMPIVRSGAMQQLLKAGIANTQGVMRNFTRTTANTATKQFEDALDRAYMQVLSGAMDYGTAISRAVSDLAKEGIQSVRYPSGHVDHMDVAARRAVLTGVSQTCGTMQRQLADELGCDFMKITSHMGARPSHAVWQGRVVTLRRDVSLSGQEGYLSPDDVGYGTGAGFKGWNCRHDWYPYYPGISVDVEDIFDARENAAVYEATQRQRALERQVRASRRACVADEAAARAATDSTVKAKMQEQLERDALLLRQREAKLKEFVRNTPLPNGGMLTYAKSRVDVADFDKAMREKVGKISENAFKKSGGNGIISLSETAIKKQYTDEIFAQKWSISLKTKDRAAIRNIFENASNEELEFWVRHGRRIGGNFYDRTTAGHYNPQDNTVHLQLDKMDERSKRIGQTTDCRVFFHETGHMFDRNLIPGSTLHEELRELKAHMERDFASYVNRKLTRGEVRESTRRRSFSEEEKRVLMQDLMDDPHIKNAVSDLIMGLTKGEVYGLYGHGIEYWSRSRALEKEAIAHMFEARMMKGERLEAYKKYFPSTYQYFEDFIAKMR